jgi:hypothetical protein
LKAWEQGHKINTAVELAKQNSPHKRFAFWKSFHEENPQFPNTVTFITKRGKIIIIEQPISWV